MHPAVKSGRAAAYIYACQRANGSGRVTSDEVAATVGVNPTQVRRDLSQMFGRSGKRGVGFRPAVLAEQLRAAVAGAPAGSGGTLLIAAAAAGGFDDDRGQVGYLIHEGAAIAAEIDRLLRAGEAVSPAGRAES